MWLETKGRLDKADEIVSWWEDKARASLNGAELPEVVDRPRPNVAKGKLTDLFTKKYIKSCCRLRMVLLLHGFRLWPKRLDHLSAHVERL